MAEGTDDGTGEPGGDRGAPARGPERRGEEAGMLDDAAAAARTEASVASLAHGGLPVSARERLADTEAGGAWTSDLSVAELAAVRAAGLEPLGLVMGSSVYHIGAQWGPRYFRSAGGGYSSVWYCPHTFMHEDMRTGYNWEHTLHERGMVEARNLAMSRMGQEAQELGAHGVAGVRLRFSRPRGVAGLMEFTAVGTAVHRPGSPPLAFPFTSHLSGQSLGKLVGTGYVPCAVTMGICAIEVDPGCGMEWRMGSWANTELPQVSEAAQRCRELAVERLEREAAEVGDGVVGVEVEFSIHELPGEAKLLELFTLGTAVRRFSAAPMPEPPLAMMRLRDRR
ncbi:MAG TPA: heavy metal-binding domain-containing protein [Acidimicrobiales bacterium]|nr:heavy metal-binding domain-containing protein [Acidimicrobiales bacterium]